MQDHKKNISRTLNMTRIIIKGTKIECKNIYIRMYICMRVCVCVCMCVCVSVCVRVCM